MKIMTGVIWPGRGDNDWDDVRKELTSMPINSTIQVSFDSYDELEACRKACMAFVRVALRCYENGWYVRSTKRGRTLFFKKSASEKNNARLL